MALLQPVAARGGSDRALAHLLGTALLELNRPAEAEAILTRVNGPDRARAELEEIHQAIDQESGSLAQHAASTAREYGLPAVISAPDATRLIRDQDRITIDGTQGLSAREAISTAKTRSAVRFMGLSFK